jgi:hypothetical protein
MIPPRVDRYDDNDLGPAKQQVEPERIRASVDVIPANGARVRAGVQGIRFLVLYRDGRPVARAVGLQPKHVLEEALGLSSTDGAA